MIYLAHKERGLRLGSTVPSAVKTTQENVGSSVKKITVEGETRPLTSGEIAMTKLVFKDSADCSYWFLQLLTP